MKIEVLSPKEKMIKKMEEDILKVIPKEEYQRRLKQLNEEYCGLIPKENLIVLLFQQIFD